MFGFTVIKDGNGEYTIVEKAAKDKGIKYKTIDSDLLKIFLIPQHANMECSKLKEMNNDGIKRLKAREQNHPIQSKISFVKKFNEIIDKWYDKYKPLEKAKALFDKLVLNDHPEMNDAALRLV